MNDKNKNLGHEWQVGIWDKMSDVYVDEIDIRFGPIIKHIFDRAKLIQGERILDLGTGTGQIAFGASSLVCGSGKVTAVDISPEMLIRAKAGAEKRALTNIEFIQGTAERIPVSDNSQDIVLSSLCMMFVIDRAEAAREIARVLRPSGRFVASVWAGPDITDIVKFQQTAGQFAPKPPVEGVGPGALGNPSQFLNQLKAAGLKSWVETKYTTFEFPNFDSAWNALTKVTTANLEITIQKKAMRAVQDLMWQDPAKPRPFRNGTHFISAVKSG